MNKKRQTSHLLLLLSAIAIIGAMSFSAGQILQGAAAQVGKPLAGAANQTAANNAISSYLPPALMKSILDQTRNTNATKFALHNAIGETTAALNKTAGTNASAIKSVLNILRNTNATSFGAHNIINATKNTTTVKH